MAERDLIAQAARDREPTYSFIDPCAEKDCDKVHRVSITIYPTATLRALPPLGNMLDELRKPSPHGELVIDDRTFHQWWHNAKNIGDFPHKMKKTMKGGKPFIQYNFNATHQQVSRLINHVNEYNSSERSCIGSALHVLGKEVPLYIPFPLNQLPVTTSLILRFHPRVASIERAGRKSISNTKMAILLAGEAAFGTYLVADKAVRTVFSCVANLYNLARQAFCPISSKRVAAN